MTPDETRCVMTQSVMPMHTNGVAGVMFGGIVMQWIDVCAGVAAMRHAGRYVTKAYLTFVAVDERGRPRTIPPLALDTDDDRRRHTAAQARRHERLRAAGRTEHPS
jgi:acyl-CoA hydrolase